MGTFVSPQVLFSNANDVEYRAWVKNTRDALLAVNPSILTLWADSPQVDVTTVVRPPPNNGSATPFNVFRFNDGLGPPIFIKLHYGMQVAQTYLGGMKVQVGTAVDASGVMDPDKIILSEVSPLASGADAGATYAAVSPGYAAFCIGGSSSAASRHQALFFFHRDYGVGGGFQRAGGEDNLGVVCGMAQGGADWWVNSAVIPGPKTDYSGSGEFSPFSRSSLLSGGKTSILPVYEMHRGRLQYNPLFVSCSASDVAMGTEIETAVVGLTPRKYKRINSAAPSLMGRAMIWE